MYPSVKCFAIAKQKKRKILQKYKKIILRRSNRPFDSVPVIPFCPRPIPFLQQEAQENLTQQTLHHNYLFVSIPTWVEIFSMEGILEQYLTPTRLFLRDAVSKVMSMSAQADPLKVGLAVMILSTAVYCVCRIFSNRSNEASVHLEDLSTQNLCKLFDYCHLSCLNSIIREQEISGKSYQQQVFIHFSKI